MEVVTTWNGFLNCEDCIRIFRKLRFRHGTRQRDNFKQNCMKPVVTSSTVPIFIAGSTFLA